MVCVREQGHHSLRFEQCLRAKGAMTIAHSLTSAIESKERERKTCEVDGHTRSRKRTVAREPVAFGNRPLSALPNG